MKPFAGLFVALGLLTVGPAQAANDGKGDVAPTNSVTATTAAAPMTSPSDSTAATNAENGRQSIPKITEEEIPLTVELLYKQVNEDLQTITKVAQLLKKIESDAIEKNFIVLVSSVSEDVKAVDGISELAREQYVGMNQAFPQVANLPEEELKKLNQTYPRQIAILRDRAVALYRRAKEFAETLNKPVGLSIERIQAEEAEQEP